MAKPSRLPFGFAWGFENQFNNYGKSSGPNTPSPLPSTQQYEQVTAGLLAQGSGIVDVSQGSIFYTNNTGNTTITSLIHNQMGRAGALLASGQIDTTSPPPEGKVVRIFFLDNSTQYANSGNLVLMTSDNMLGQNSISEFMASNGKWYQVWASRASTGGSILTFTGAGSASFNVNGINTVVSAITAATVLVSISGGQQGQSIILIQQTGGVTLTISSNGNIAIPGTNALVEPLNGNYTITKFGTSWYLDRGAV